MTELLGREDVDDTTTERPWLRVDIAMRAGFDIGKGIAMPSAATWSKWSREASMRLGTIEPLVSHDITRELPDGHPAVLAWQGEPELEVICNSFGELQLQSVKVCAFQGIDLPRRWDDTERPQDDEPDEQLALMFRRVKTALYAWGEVMDHLL